MAFKKKTEQDLHTYYIEESTRIGQYSLPKSDLLSFTSNGASRRKPGDKSPQSYSLPGALVTQNTPYDSGISTFTPFTPSPPSNDLEFNNSVEYLGIASNETPWRRQAYLAEFGGQDSPTRASSAAFGGHTSILMSVIVHS